MTEPASKSDNSTGLKFDIITPDGVVFSGKVESLVAPGASGSFGVLMNHAPFMTTLAIGKVEITRKTDGSASSSKQEKQYFATSGGFIQVLDNQVTLLAETCEPADKIDIERAEAALKRAQERLKSPTKDIDIIRAEFAMKRALNRIKVAKYK
jgi:F-type H+-transporting ATPase subunit epsilon